MPGRPLLFDLRSRNDLICRACLSKLARQPPVPRWSAAFSTLPAREARTRARSAGTKRNSPPPLDDSTIQQIVEDPSLPPQNESGTGNADYSVQFWEQDGKTRKLLDGQDAFDESFNLDDASEFKESIESMADMVDTSEDKEVVNQVLADIRPLLQNIKSTEDIAMLIQKLESGGAQTKANIQKATNKLPREIAEDLNREIGTLLFPDEPLSQTAPVPQIPEKSWTPNQRRKISRLNTSLRNMYREKQRDFEFTAKGVQAVYKAYHAARITLAHSWSSVPLQVWDFVWEILSAEKPVNANRLAHISMLARDMSEAKVTLSPRQQLLTIEAVFVDGWESKAIDNWRRCMGTLGSEDSEVFKNFWELGVRMYCRLGDLAQAERAVSRLLDHHSDPRILLEIIRTCSETGTAEGHERAWNAYWQMRQLLGPDMQLADYDQVVSSFLTTNQTENALYAFVDMMSDGQVNLKEQKRMPSFVANKFFLGKWLKRLIGARDLDGAYTVVEFMRQKGVLASPIQLNGLVGAWLRSGTAKDLTKADNLAWEMIQSRIEFSEARKAVQGKSIPLAESAEPKPMPRATLETFSLLAENYRLREKYDQLEVLWNAFREAEMNADAFIMNQLIESYIHNGEWERALALYKSAVTEKGLKPDPFTFSALWKTLGINRLHVLAPEAFADDIAEARRLFAEGVKFRDVFMPEGMDGQLARKILHTFRRLQDQAGFLVALTALKDLFKFLPTENLVLEMIIGSMRLSWDTASQRKRLMLAKRDITREMAAWARENGSPDDEQVKPGDRGQALYDYLQHKFWPEQGDATDQKKYLTSVAMEMGVYDLLGSKRKT